MKQLTVRMSDEVDRLVQREAQRRGVTQSVVMREALMIHFGLIDPPSREPRRGDPDRERNP
jgi:hypothetical protein